MKLMRQIYKNRLLCAVGMLVFLLSCNFSNIGEPLDEEFLVAVEWSPAGQALAVMGSHRLFIVDASFAVTYESGPIYPASISWTSTGDTLMVLDNPRTIYAIDVSGVPSMNWQMEVDPMSGMSLSPDGNLIAGNMMGDTYVRLWRIVDGNDGPELEEVTLLGRHQDYQPQFFAWRLDSDWLATGSIDGIVKVWNVSQRELVYQVDIIEESEIHSHLKLVWSGNNSLGIASEHRIGLVTEDGTTRLFPANYPSIAWSPDAQYFAEVNIDTKAVTVVETATGSISMQLSGCIGDIAWSPDGTTMAVATDRDLCVWDLSTQHLTRIPIIQ